MKLRLWTEYVGFITIGLVSNIIGPMIPAIQSSIGMSYGQAGLILSGQFLGMLCTVLIGGYLSDRFGKKPYLLSGGVFLIAGLSGSALSHSYLALLAWTILTGIGFGALEVGINALCADRSQDDRGTTMNLLHVFFGLGAIGGPVLATACLRLFNWRWAFGLSTILPLVVVLMLLPLQIPNVTTFTANGTRRNTPFRQTFLWAAGIAIFVYVGIEVSVYGWLPAFWNTAGNRLVPASLTATVFWFTLTLGRLITGRIADRIGLSKYLMGTTVFTLTFALVWYLSPGPVWTLATVLFLGLSLSGIFPTAMASATERFPQNTGSVAAFLSVFASLGGFLLPSGLGRLADFKGIEVFPLFITVLSVFLAAFSVWAWGITEKTSMSS